MRTLTINVAGMHCASCGLLIDDALLDLDGVITSVTDTRSGICLVSAEPRVSDAAVLAAIADAGYTGALARPSDQS